MKISSVAGSGKTFTAQQIVKELKPESGLYTAFNKAIVEDSAGKFPPEVECRTINSLAYEYYNGKIDHFTYLCIEESISYAEKQEIMQMMDKFFSSDAIDIKAYFRPLKNGAIAFKYISKMRKKQIPATFAFTVKYFHMMLYKKFIDLHYDMVIMDECLPGYMQVQTMTGTSSIKALCEKLQKGEQVLVRSFNSETQNFEYKKAKNPLISYSRETLRIKTEGLNVIDCTPNHKILTTRGYVRADELIMGKDVVLLDSPVKQKTKVMLNKEQYQIMLGSYLGDGSLAKQSMYGTYRLRFTQGMAQLGYLKWKASAFSLESVLHVITSGYTGRKDVRQTNSTPTFILEKDPFTAVLEDMTALGLAIWIMDDGSGQYYKKAVQVSCGSIPLERVELLRTMLIEKFNLNTTMTLDKRKNSYNLHFGVKATAILKDLIYTYIHPDVAYKFGFDSIKEPLELNNSYKKYGGNFVTKIEPIGLHTVYDFEVEDNHNFLVSKSYNGTKTIVHNCQDASMVTLAIIKLINAPKKIFLGDPYQNLYSFMHTVNAFEIMKNEGVLMSLTQSYRVGTEIAKGIEKFGRSYMNPNFEFKGTNHEDTTINTRAYLSRTNSYLVARLIELQTKGISYRFLREVKEIFALPLAVISANAGREVFDRRYKYLEKEKVKHQKLVDKGKTDTSFYGHMKAVAPNDVALTSAIMLVITNGPKGIYDAYAKAKQHEPLENAIVLATSFVSKGLTFDWVYIEDDLNKAVSKINKSGVSTQDDLTVVFLYYVAASRARIKLVNAQFIE